jgi:hypothetical protein
MSIFPTENEYLHYGLKIPSHYTPGGMVGIFHIGKEHLHDELKIPTHQSV